MVSHLNQASVCLITAAPLYLQGAHHRARHRSTDPQVCCRKWQDAGIELAYIPLNNLQVVFIPHYLFAAMRNDVS